MLRILIVLTITRIVSGNLFLIKVTRKEKLSSNSLHETLGRSQFTALRLLRLNLLESKMVLLRVVLREAWQCLYYDFKHVPRSAFGRYVTLFICESKGCVNTWMAIVAVVENRGQTYRKRFVLLLQCCFIFDKLNILELLQLE